MGPGSLSSPYALNVTFTGDWLRAYHRVRNADGASAEMPRTEIRMDPDRAADEIDKRVELGSTAAVEIF